MAGERGSEAKGNGECLLGTKHFPPCGTKSRVKGANCFTPYSILEYMLRDCRGRAGKMWSRVTARDKIIVWLQS